MLLYNIQDFSDRQDNNHKMQLRLLIFFTIHFQIFFFLQMDMSVIIQILREHLSKCRHVYNPCPFETALSHLQMVHHLLSSHLKTSLDLWLCPVLLCTLAGSSSTNNAKFSRAYYHIQFHDPSTVVAIASDLSWRHVYIPEA
jgi:hypothetical protein